MKNFLQFVNEVLNGSSSNLDKKFSFYLSDKFMKTLEPLKHEYIIAKLFTDLEKVQSREILAKDPVNYLDIDDNGISFLKSRYFDEPEPWTSSRRVKLKATKVLKDIYNQEYIDSFVKQTDVEAFANKMAAMKISLNVEEYRGLEILRAYNYKGELTPDFGQSCANFKQSENSFGKYTEPKVSEFDIYTKNPDNCGVVVVWENGKIMGRRSFQQGIQVCDSGTWKKGEFHTVYGGFYGKGGSFSKYDKILIDYMKNKYPDSVSMANYLNGGVLCIHMETRFTYYCPFDTMYVNFEHNLITDNSGKLPNPFKNYIWERTYHATCPKNLVKKRLDEEKIHDPKIDITLKSFGRQTQPNLPFKRPLTNKEIEMLEIYFPHYTWAKNIDADDKLVMSNRSTWPPAHENGYYYLTENDLDILTSDV